MLNDRSIQSRTGYSGSQGRRVILRILLIAAFVSQSAFVEAQEDTGISNGSEGLNITPVPPLPPAPTFVPELSPQVDFVVTAGLPGGVACSDLTLEQLDDLAIGYCMNIGKLGNLSAAWYPTVCQATCPTSRRSLLQVNPVIFNVDCVRTTEDPEEVPVANQEALDLEQAALKDGLLTDVLEATLPGSELLAEEVSSTFVEVPGAAGTGEGATSEPSLAEEQDICRDISPSEEYNCRQQRLWGKCDEEWMVAGNYCQSTCGRCGSNGQSNPGVLEVWEPPKMPGMCTWEGKTYSNGAIAYCETCVRAYCICCDGKWANCRDYLSPQDRPQC